jgi:hypothetical protein
MRLRHDANLDEAITLRRANPVTRVRAALLGLLLLGLLGLYGWYGYRERVANQPVPELPIAPTTLLPPSVPGGH